MLAFRRHIVLGVFIISFSLLMTACGSTSNVTANSETAQVHEGDTVTVTIENFTFYPENITVKPGTRVIFINKDVSPHNVVSGTKEEVADPNHIPLFASKELHQNETFEYVFEEEGEFPYACTIASHYLLGMVGKVTVTAEAGNVGEAVEGAEQHTLQNEQITSTLDNAVQTIYIPELDVETTHDYVTTPEGLVELQPFAVDGNVKQFALDIQEIEHELLSGVTVTAWAFNGIMPGPTLRVTEGDTVRVHFTNTHHQPHTIHWHGIYADQEHDGVPHTSAAVMPGETRVYEFTADEAGTFWYHCHVDSFRHVDMGMYGALIVEPKDKKTWDREYTLVLDDWDSNIDPMADKYDPDYNHFVINGKAFPETPTLVMPVGETTRVRMINAGYNNISMHLHGPSFQVVATDGRPLPVPYQKDTLDVAPGERYDIEVVPTKAGEYPFHAHNLQYVLNDGVYPGGIHLMVNIVHPEDIEE